MGKINNNNYNQLSISIDNKKKFSCVPPMFVIAQFQPSHVLQYADDVASFQLPKVATTSASCSLLKSTLVEHDGVG